jgi:hypothetical protein
MRRVVVRAALAVLAVAVPGPAAPAQVILGPAVATANATVQPAGPRAAPNGTNFFNVEGNANGSFASFGTADFAPFSRPGSVSGVSGVTVKLIESNASFTAPGPVNFYFASNTATPVTPGATTPAFIAGAGSEGVGTQLGTLFLLGTGTFTTTGNVNTGQVDTYALTGLSTAAGNYIVNELNSGGPFRLVITPGSDAVSATWAGFSNTTAGQTGSPALSFSVSAVPEPSALALLALAAPGLVLAVRRPRRAAPRGAAAHADRGDG